MSWHEISPPLGIPRKVLKAEVSKYRWAYTEHLKAAHRHGLSQCHQNVEKVLHFYQTYFSHLGEASGTMNASEIQHLQVVNLENRRRKPISIDAKTQRIPKRRDKSWWLMSQQPLRPVPPARRVRLPDASAEMMLSAGYSDFKQNPVANQSEILFICGR